MDKTAPDDDTEPTQGCPPGSACDTVYGGSEYKAKRQSLLGTISKSTMLSTIRGNSSLVLQALTMTAVAGIAVGAVTLGGWHLVALIAGIVTISGVGAIAGYLDEKMSRTASMNFGEAQVVANTELSAKMHAQYSAQEMAVAMDQTIGKELREANAESRQSRKAVEEMRSDMKKWQERVEQTALATRHIG